jgi:hypothetical protein
MSKLIKRIRKSDKHPENCVVVGDVWGEMPFVIETFRNVFVKNTHKQYPRVKNVIVRDKFQEMAIFPQIDHAFIDSDCVEYIESIEKVLTHYSPVIYIGYGEFLEKDISKYLNSLNYEIIELRKDYQIWKRKK